MKDSLANILSQNLRRLRTESGMTQQEVAAHLQLDRSAYARYETGAALPSCAVLRALAREFGVTTDSLLGAESASPARFTVAQSDLPLLLKTDSLIPLGECNQEERAFLSLLRHMDADQRQRALRACLDILKDTE